MQLHLVSSSGAREFPVSEIERCRSEAGFTWLDVDRVDERALEVLASVGIGVQPLADCGERTLIPKVAVHDEVAVLIVHSLDDAGHLLQVASVFTDDLLVTVHGPLTEGVPTELATRETKLALDRIRAADLVVARPLDLVAYLIDLLAEWLEQMLAQTSARAGALDRRLRQGETGDPERFLEQAFTVRHELLTIANRAAQTREACSTAAVLFARRFGDEGGFDALRGRFERLRTLCDGEKEFLQGVLDYYESQVNTKMNIAMERLAVIAAVALPVTAIGGILGMNTIVSAQTNVLYTILVVVFMAGLAGVMLVWAKRQGWW